MVPPNGTETGVTNCKPEVYSQVQFSNRGVNIGGTRPGSGEETADQRLVDVIFYSPANFGSSPGTMTVTLKNNAGQVVDGPRILTKKDNTAKADPRPQPEHEAIYDARFANVGAGTYSVCADYIISCESFEKKAGVPLTNDAKLVYGQSEVGSQIKAVVHLNYIANGTDPAKKVGPYDIRVTRPDGTSQVFQTSSQDIAARGERVVDTFNVDAEVTAFMRPFDTGAFQVCVVVINSCKTVNKEHNKEATVRFDFKDADAQRLIAASSGGGNAQKPTCDSSGDPASYLLCPIFNGLANLSEWLFESIIQPFLNTPPISTDPNDGSFKIWSTFRIYGDILLTGAVLVIVFGEAIGGGVMDAITARKAIPRILVAAVFINLSVYIMALLVDFTNILVATIGNVLTAPIDMKWKADTGTSFGVYTMGLMGLLLGGGGLVTTLVGVFTLKAAFIKSALWVAFFMILPIVFAVIGIFVVLIIRKGLLLFLVLVSPVAFALYCLPNTEKYFFSFVKLTFKTLAVGVIIVILFSIGQVLSITILEANSVGPEMIKNANWVSVETSKILAFFTAILVMFVVLGASVFAFQFAGGVIGFAGEKIAQGRKGVNEKMKGRRQMAQQQFRGMQTQNRERAYRAMGSWGENKGWLGKRAASFGQGRLSAGGLRNIYGESAAYREQQMKVMQAINDTGDDTQQRALTVNKQHALDTDRNGGTHWRWKDGKQGGSRQFRTLGGLWVGENDVDEAYKSWGHNQAALQWSLGHEMEKASTQEEQDYLRTNFQRLNYKRQGSASSVLGGGQTWNMSDGEMQGIWKGAGFAKQNVNREWKHYSYKDGKLAFNRLSAAQELDEKKSAYELGQTNADYWTSMGQGVLDARERHDRLSGVINSGGQLNAEQQQQLREDKEFLGRASRIAGRLKSTGAMYAQTGGQVQQVPGTGVQQGEAAIGAGAISRTGEEMVRFARIAETHAPEYTGPTMETTPTGSAPLGRAVQPTTPIDNYEDIHPATGDAIDNRVGAGRRGPEQ